MSVEQPTLAFLPDPLPTDFTVWAAGLGVPAAGPEALATLYGERGRKQPLRGPTLLVGSTEGSATTAGPGVVGAHVDLGGGVVGEIAHVRGWTWVTFPYKGCIEDCASFVIGRRLSDAEVVAAARGARATGTAAPSVRDVPHGLVPLVSGQPSDGFMSGEVPVVEVRRGDDIWVSVYTVRVDPKLALLWAFWLDDPRGSEVRGHPGWSGRAGGTGDGGSTWGQIWVEDGQLISVIGSYHATAADVDAVAKALVKRPLADLELLGLAADQAHGR